MKIHTTNYFNTFIEVAEDCPVSVSEIPTFKKEKSIANYQYEILIKNPYQYTSDYILFEISAIKNDISPTEKPEAKSQFFSKGQPCFRTSPLTKRYGFGVHFNSDGKLALVPLESEEYTTLVQDNSIQKVKAMRSKKL